MSGLAGCCHQYIGAALKDLALHLVFLSNTTWQATFSINGVYWTMAIEVQFYLLLPGIAWLIYQLGHRVRPALAVLLVFLLLALIGQLCHAVESDGSLSDVPVISSFVFSYSGMPYWLGVFGCGIVCSVIYTYFTRVVRLRRRQAERLHGLCSLAFFAGVALALALAFVPPLHQVIVFDLLYGLAYAGLLMGVVLGGKILRLPFASRPMRFVGLISYSVYIWHRVVLHILEPRLHTLAVRPQVAVLFVVGTFASIAVSYVSFQVFERPFINARKKSHERQKEQVAIAPAAAE